MTQGVRYRDAPGRVGAKRKGVPFGTPFLQHYGSACWARTSDPLINSQLLYQLS